MSKRLAFIAALALAPLAAACTSGADADTGLGYSEYDAAPPAALVVDYMAEMDYDLMVAGCIERTIIGDDAFRADMRAGYGPDEPGKTSFASIWQAFKSWCSARGL